MLPLNIDPQQILLHLFNFILLYAILSFLVYKPVKAFIEKRRQHYLEMEHAAVKKLEQAEQVEADYHRRAEELDQTLKARRQSLQAALDEQREAMLREAAEEAEKIVAEARRDAQRHYDRVIRDGQSELLDFAKSNGRVWSNTSTSDAFEEFLDTAERGSRNGHDNA